MVGNHWGRRLFLLAVVSGVLAVPPVAAQQAAGIAGVVRDEAGLAIPGVTVEAASPALIEKVRTAITDAQGRFNIVDLRPGAYTVTFTLPGFSTVRREGIDLPTGFVATVNVTMTVGAIEETITVTGAAPVVDTTSIRQQSTLNTSQLEELPAGNIGLQTLAYVTPGFATTQADVGGTRDSWSAQGAYTFYHGKTGTRASFDGFRNQYFIGAASGVGYITDQGTIQELQLETTGMGAESGSGSTSLNAIPKSGSNTFHGSVDGYFSNSGMQGTNIDDNLRSFGITQAGSVQRIYRIGAQSGGPIKRDRLWYFAAVGRWGSRVNQPNAYFNPLQGKSGMPAGPHYTATLFYPGQPGSPYADQADLYKTGKPAASFDWFRTHSGRLTWQMTESQRLNWFGDIQKSCRCTTGPFTGANAIESERGWDWYPAGVVNGTWTMPVTNRLLLEAGINWQTTNWVNFAETGVTRDDRSILERATNYRYGATSALTAPIARTGRGTQRFSLSYVTGTHNLKVGISDEQGFNDEGRDNNHKDGLSYDFLNGKPNRIQYRALPFFQQERQNHELGIFGQDAWTIQRLTLNLGLRFDWVTMGFPEADLPAGPYVPARHVDALSGVPDWKDVNPRFGVAYDVFGNGRTAIKFSGGRFNQLSRSDFTRRFHPFSSSVSSAFRNWTDNNGDYIPDCNLANFAAQSPATTGSIDTCGPISNQFFGLFLPQATLFDDKVKFDNRDYLWDFNVEVQHEVIRGLAIDVTYNHNWDGSFIVTENTAYGPEAFDEFCITVPNDPRLPNAGHEQCGYYDINPEFFGVGQSRVTTSDEFGTQKRYWDGFTFGAEGRLPRGISVGGGLDIGRQVDDHCYTVDIPNQPAGITGAQLSGGPFCRIVTAWANTADFRLRGTIPVRDWFNASFIYRNTPGSENGAQLTVSSANVRFIDPSRTALTTSQTVYLYAPNSVYGDRFQQLDLSVNKSFRLGGWARLRAAFDLYNALNSNSVQSTSSAYGARWLYPTGFLDARLARITGSIEF